MLVNKDELKLNEGEVDEAYAVAFRKFDGFQGIQWDSSLVGSHIANAQLDKALRLLSQGEKAPVLSQLELRKKCSTEADGIILGKPFCNRVHCPTCEREQQRDADHLHYQARMIEERSKVAKEIDQKIYDMLPAGEVTAIELIKKIKELCQSLKEEYGI